MHPVCQCCADEKELADEWFCHDCKETVDFWRDRALKAEADLNECQLRYIEASNPGIDMEQVRAARSAGVSDPPIVKNPLHSES